MIVHNDGSDDDGRSISNKVSPWPASVPPPAAIPSPRRRPAATVPIAQQSMPVIDMPNVGDMPWDVLITKEKRGLG